ncbi:class I SAM-dependent methyltransferase [Desulfitobacterium sp.]|uniref:class I SAM-dependent methyltransferase n=1 Tax=Desulfitobacterium sp. TaxID=49981 RepID=UPI002BE36E0F|nr:methyltransferase domain-containing protein [Desulfitobacterium sp.]HVJ47605.1 methyltransferase domain-containing protein [Desulfitobacterium sp.]
MNIYDLFMSPLEKRFLTKIRKNIIPRALGNVLEIGYGTGVNFQYYNLATVKSVSALDTKSTPAVKIKAELPLKFFEGRAEDLPFLDESFDTVVETLVFCSVKNLDNAMNEVLRVLKPGGIFIFMDHVLPEKKSMASLFKATNTVWPKIAGGCNLTREPYKLIEASGLVIEQSGRSGHDIFRWGIGRKA